MQRIAGSYSDIAFQNAEIKSSYLKEDTNTCRFSWRDANANQLVLGIYSNRMTLTNWDGSTWTTLASNTAATNANNVWYDVQLIMDRGKVEVWRRAQSASAYVHIFTVTTLLRTKSPLHCAVVPICVAVPPCEKETLTQRRQGTGNAAMVVNTNLEIQCF